MGTGWSMRLLVDDNAVTLDRPTLAAAIAAGAAHAESRGRIVVEIKADGVTLAERDIESAPDVPGTFKEVALSTASKSELGASVLEAAASALSDLATAQRFVADQILASKLEPAMGAMKEVLGVWQGVRDGADQVCSLLGTDLPTLGERAGMRDAAKEIIPRTTATLAEVMRCVQAQDWSALADVMEEDLCGLANAWQDLLGVIARHLDAENR